MEKKIEDVYCIKKVMKPENVMKIVKVLNTNQDNVYYAPLTCSSAEKFAIKPWKELTKDRSKSPLKFINKSFESTFHQSSKWWILCPSSSKATVFLNGELIKICKSYVLEDGVNLDIKYPDLDEKISLVFKRVDPAADLENLLVENDHEKHLIKEKEIHMKGNSRALELMQINLDKKANSLETERQNSKLLREEIKILQIKQSENDSELEEAKIPIGQSLSDQLAPVNDQLKTMISLLQPLQINIAELQEECQRAEKDTATKTIELKEQVEKLLIEKSSQASDTIRLSDELNECKKVEKDKDRKLKSMAGECKELKMRLEKHLDQIAKPSSESIRLHKEIKEYKQVDKDKTREMNFLLAENKGLKQQLKKLRVEISKHSSESIHLNNELKKCQKVENDKIKEMESLTKEIEELKRELKYRYGDIAHDTVELTRLLEELNATQEEFGKIKNQLNTEKASFRETLFKEKSSYLEVWNQLQELQKKLKQSFTDNLECTICHEIVKLPDILNCAHTFCSDCINTWRATRNDCPTCKKLIVQQGPNLTLKNIIETFKDQLCE